MCFIVLRGTFLPSTDIRELHAQRSSLLAKTLQNEEQSSLGTCEVVMVCDG